MSIDKLRRTDRVDNVEFYEDLKNLRKPLSGSDPLNIHLMVQEGELYELTEDSKLHCYACGHNCKISNGGRGICQVRYHLNGKLYVPHGYVAALQCDPTEKKPFNHLHPGSDTLTFGMLGCDIHCPYCQNWDISQALRDSHAGRAPTQVTPQQMVQMAKLNDAKCVASSYNEPLITSEWAVSIFKEAKAAGFTCMYISNGNATRDVLEYIRPYTDGYKIDLKTMNEKNYRKLGAVLETVLEGMRMVYEMGFWTEIVTLVIPGFNDSDDELRDAARYIKSLSPDIPWHVTAFHQDYKMVENDNTDVKTLMRAAEIGYSEGLRYVYAGNLPGRVGDYEHTFCPTCHKKLIDRVGYVVRDYQLTSDGKCPSCQTTIAGIWPASKQEVRLGTVEDLYSRRPRPVRWPS